VRALDLRETVERIPVSVTDLTGREATRNIPLTVYRPDGPGPHPVAIVSHGRAAGAKRAQPLRQRYEALARYLASKGFAVIVPTRVGYGENYGTFDPESSGGCERMVLEPMVKAASDQVLAALAWAASQPDMDVSRWLALGASVGGVTTLAVASRQPPGLVAAINFAGGAGGNPEQRPADPCRPEHLARLWTTQAAQAHVPSLWLYWENDRYWGPDIPRRWARAWAEGGGQVEFHALGPVGPDGHAGMSLDMDHWVPLVEEFMARAGFTRPGTVPRPRPTAYAAVSDIDRVPLPLSARESIYRRFLAAPLPRAFAIGPGGQAGYATGDWATGRALGFCQSRRGERCALYAVDDDVVWGP
jgi:dienelactone hydrolase